MKRNGLSHGIFIIAFCLTACNSASVQTENTEGFSEGGEKDTFVQEDTVIHMLMTHSSSLQPYSNIKLNGCDFKIVLNEFGDTTYWSTSDDNFRTPEGFKVGVRWKELPVELQNSVNALPGWGYYIRLNSAWQLGFCEGVSCTDTKPNNESNVDWIFKRND